MHNKLKQQIELIEADRDMLNDLATKHHYLHKPIFNKAYPFGWMISYNGELWQPDGKPSGFIIFASIHFTKLKNEFGFDGLPTKWQVLNLSRLWLHDDLPKNGATCTIAKSLKLVQRRWLEVHPPKLLNEPYHVLKIISFCDLSLHQGTIYKAANFRLSGQTISHYRKNGKRGKGGRKMLRFIYDLKKPNWEYKDIKKHN